MYDFTQNSPELYNDMTFSDEKYLIIKVTIIFNINFDRRYPSEKCNYRFRL
jgi:hypothetical protein